MNIVEEMLQFQLTDIPTDSVAHISLRGWFQSLRLLIGNPRTYFTSAFRRQEHKLDELENIISHHREWYLNLHRLKA